MNYFISFLCFLILFSYIYIIISGIYVFLYGKQNKYVERFNKVSMKENDSPRKNQSIDRTFSKKYNVKPMTVKYNCQARH